MAELNKAARSAFMAPFPRCEQGTRLRPVVIFFLPAVRTPAWSLSRGAHRAVHSVTRDAEGVDGGCQAQVQGRDEPMVD